MYPLPYCFKAFFPGCKNNTSPSCYQLPELAKDLFWFLQSNSGLGNPDRSASKTFALS